MDQPDNRCDLSRLSVPSQSGSVPVAMAYVDAVAQNIGMNTSERDSLNKAVQEAVSNVIQHAYEPGERGTIELTCERVPVGLRVSIRDMGMPFEPSDDPLCENPFEEPGNVRAGCGLALVRRLVDEVDFLDYGQAGKELVLIKYLDEAHVTSYMETCSIPSGPQLRPNSSEKDASGKITFRPMDPSEALEVAKCVYRVYGRSYAAEMVYYPKRFAKLLEQGKVVSFVAVSESRTIVGHCALIFFHDSPEISEIGIGVVDPLYRKQGIFQTLARIVIEAGRNMGLKGIYGRAVSNHTYSQRTAHHLGLGDCMILLGNFPASTSFKGLGEQLSQRQTLIVHYVFLDVQASRLIFPPSRHEAMIRRIYDNIGASHIQYHAGSSPVNETSGTRSILQTRLLASQSVAILSVKTFGSDAVYAVRSITRELCLQHIDVIHLHLDLTDPMTSLYCTKFEEMGFFFAGLLPFDMGGEGLVLQYLNNVPFDYGKVKIESSFGRELLEYVRGVDPNVF